MQLIKYDAACQALAECRRVDEVNDWVDRAAAVEAYGRISRNFEIERDAAEIRVRAERRLGQLLIETANCGERTTRGGDRAKSPLPTLLDMGISRDRSARAQSIARIPEPEFESTLAEHREEQRKVTGRMMERLSRQAAEVVPPAPDEARLYDDLMTAWNRATPAVQARFIEAVNQTATPLPATPTATVWATYATAYHDRYGAEPVRNATVNGQLAQIVKRLGAFDAPHVARYYVQSNAAFYVRGGHSVGLMLKDCEKLRTEWATNTRITDTKARQSDRTEAAGQVWGKLLRDAESQDAGSQP